MPEATDATLTSLVESGPIKSLRIEAFRETADSRYLGVVGVSFRHPIRKSEDGNCVHNDPKTHGCTVYAQRPAICRTYDCRNDKRIWLDFEKRIPAEGPEPDTSGG